METETNSSSTFAGATPSTPTPTFAAAVATTVVPPTLIISKIQKHKERVIVIITKTVTASIFPVVSRLHSDPFMLWATLKKKYESSALQRKLDLKTALVELRFTEGDSMEDYLKKIEYHVMELGLIGEEFPKKELI